MTVGGTHYTALMLSENQVLYLQYHQWKMVT